MSRSHNNDGRTASEPRHVRLYHWLLDSPAYQSLDPYGRALLVEFKRRYSGVNNGNITFSGAEMEAALGCSNKPIMRALADLLDRGFIKISQKGNFDWKWRREGGSRANTYILTEYPVDYPERVLSPGTKEFMKWRPPAKPKEKTAGCPQHRNGVPTAPHQKKMGCPEHPIEVPRAPHKPVLEVVNAVPRAPAYNIPPPPADEGLQQIGNLALITAMQRISVGAPPSREATNKPAREGGFAPDDRASSPQRPNLYLAAKEGGR